MLSLLFDLEVVITKEIDCWLFYSFQLKQKEHPFGLSSTTGTSRGDRFDTARSILITCLDSLPNSSLLLVNDQEFPSGTSQPMESVAVFLYVFLMLCTANHFHSLCLIVVTNFSSPVCDSVGPESSYRSSIDPDLNTVH